MYPNKKTEDCCKLVSWGGMLLAILSVVALYGAFTTKGAAIVGSPKLRALGFAALAYAGFIYFSLGRYGIREQLAGYLVKANIGVGIFLLTQIITSIALFMKVPGMNNVLFTGANIFTGILGVFFCAVLTLDYRKKFFNMHYDQLVLAALAALSAIDGILLLFYNGSAEYLITPVEKYTAVAAHILLFVLPAAFLWFCDRITEPFTDNEVAQIRVAEKQAVRIAEAQKATEKYNKIEAQKASERRKREEELKAKEEAEARRLEEEKQERIAAEKRAVEREIQKAKEAAEAEAKRAEEEAKRAEEEEARRQEEIQRQLEEAQRAAEEAQKRAEEEAKRAAAAAEEARRKAEEEVRRAQEAQEEARRKAERLRESALKKAEAAKAEAAKKEEEIRLREEAAKAEAEVQAQIDEEEQAKLEELERRKAELEARRKEKEAQRRIEAEQRRLEEEALAMMTPEERRIYEEEKALMEQEELLRKQDEEARAEALREVEAYRRAEEELRASAAEEETKKIETLQMALKAGLITKEEFEARKAKILGQ